MAERVISWKKCNGRVVRRVDYVGDVVDGFGQRLKKNEQISLL